MAEATPKSPVKGDEQKPDQPATPTVWHPFESLRREIDRLFEDFFPRRSPVGRTVFDAEPFWRGEVSWGKAPAVDIAESNTAYEITAELPGMDQKNVEVVVSDGVLTIKGEKKEAKEDKQKDYYLSERRYGSFQRSFRVPDGVEADKIEAKFQNGVLAVTMPKAPEAQKSEKKIAIKAE